MDRRPYILIWWVTTYGGCALLHSYKINDYDYMLILINPGGNVEAELGWGRRNGEGDQHTLLLMHKYWTTDC